MENKEHPWTLGSLEIILMKTGNQDVSTAMYMDIWQRNAGNQKRIKKQENVTSMTKWDI